jgi:hypothetical protein
MSSCNQEIEITGHWRPFDSFKAGQDLNAFTPQFRDLILNSDSTFVSMGFDQQPTETEGWNNTVTQKGEWNFSNGILSLKIEGGTSRPVKFKVLKLTKREMIMESEFMSSIEFKLMRLKN